MFCSSVHKKCDMNIKIGLCEEQIYCFIGKFSIKFLSICINIKLSFFYIIFLKELNPSTKTKGPKLNTLIRKTVIRSISLLRKHKSVNFLH